jgi:hypothetical protein
LSALGRGSPCTRADAAFPIIGAPHGIEPRDIRRATPAAQAANGATHEAAQAQEDEVTEPQPQVDLHREAREALDSLQRVFAGENAELPLIPPNVPWLERQRLIREHKARLKRLIAFIDRLHALLEHAFTNRLLSSIEAEFAMRLHKLVCMRAAIERGLLESRREVDAIRNDA